MWSGSASRMRSQVVGIERSPGRAKTGRPPAATTNSGTQWPPTNGGSIHSSTKTVGPGRPARCAAVRSRRTDNRSCRLATKARPRSGTPAASATVCTESMTSTSECGSICSTVAWQLRRATARSTSPLGTAHTRHRSWLKMRSGLQRARASSSSEYNSSPAANRARTSSSISRGVRCFVSIPPTTISRPCRASVGKLHSKVTPRS